MGPHDPIFLVGVPRSGTTLLRALLGQHPNLCSGPESPWLCGSFGGVYSLKALIENWRSHTLGPVAGGVCEERLFEAAAAFVSGLLAVDGKRWVEKTPNHIAEIEFLHRLFPAARFVHLVRDGRDVACSSRRQKNGGLWGRFLEHSGERLPNSPLLAVQRWSRWNERYEKWKQSLGLASHTLRYEDLVTRPEPTLRTLLRFLNEPWSEDVLDYPPRRFSAPEWEAGARDVLRWDRLAVSEIGKWERELSPWQKWAAYAASHRTLARYGYLSRGASGQLAGVPAPEYA